MSNNKDTTKLDINVLSYQKYDELSTHADNELWVVQENQGDDFSIASRTYADVGRNAVVVSEIEPDVSKSKIWIIPNEEVEQYPTMDIDMKNITKDGIDKIFDLIIPDFSSSESIPSLINYEFTPTSYGYIYTKLGHNSMLVMSNSALVFYDEETGANDKKFSSFVIGKDQTIKLDSVSGQVEIIFIPFKGVYND